MKEDNTHPQPFPQRKGAKKVSIKKVSSLEGGLRWVLHILLLCLSISSYPQSNMGFHGYIKQMQTIIPMTGQNALMAQRNFMQDNLLHHRLNGIWYPSDKLTVRAELRDRVMYGDLAAFMGPQADQGNDVFKLSGFLYSGTNVYWHLLFDRMYLEYVTGDWEIRLGRQRINWGINTVYNPNDIFNAANFFDFDYEERPGADALRITKYTGTSSSYELAFKYFDNIDEATGAFLWKTTKWNYDFQLLVGKDQEYGVAGGGWTGYIKEDYGFKGEVSYFNPYTAKDSLSSTLVYSLGTDFKIGEDGFLMAGLLYSQQEDNVQSIDFSQTFTNLNSSNNISARNLSGSEWTYMLVFSKPINARISWSIAEILMPDISTNIIANTLTYSIKDNWDMDFVNQLILVKRDQILPVNLANFRLKYSY